MKRSVRFQDLVLVLKAKIEGLRDYLYYLDYLLDVNIGRLDQKEKMQKFKS